MFEDMINTIQLGDCYELIKNIPDKSIDLIVTDPPYEYVAGGKNSIKNHFGTNYQEEYSNLYYDTGTTRETERLSIMANSQKSLNNIKGICQGFDYSILDEFMRIMKIPNIYVWCSKKQLGKLINYFEEKGCYIDLITWHKTNPLPLCNTYLSDTEYCVFARKKGSYFKGIYETLKKYYIDSLNVEDKKLYNHPTIKPLNIIKNLILNSSKENDIVLDCFCGSGTTCVACKETGRIFIGMEIDPEYHKLAVDRLNGILANGQTSIFTDSDKLKKEG
jgi:DNA modification methylase